jgi:hypothetical protein
VGNVTFVYDAEMFLCYDIVSHGSVLYTLFLATHVGRVRG